MQSLRPLLFVLLIPLFFCQGRSVIAGEAESVWMLEKRFGCPLISCAVFRPQGGRAVSQSSFSPQPLTGPGTLELPAGDTVLLHGTAALTFTGPLRLHLGADGTFALLSMGRGTYRHPRGQAERLRVLFPAFIAGTEGTEFTFIVARDGTFFLEVLDARVILQPTSDPGTQIVLERGMAIIAGDQELAAGRFRRLYGADVKLQRDALAPSAARGIGSRELYGSKRRCGAPLLPLTQHPITPAGAREIFEVVSTDQARCELEDTFRSTREMAELFPNSNYTARALYQAWLQARTAGDPRETELSSLLQTRFPASGWARQLEGVSRTLPRP